LELAVRGKLVPQDESDEPASELLKRIAAEKAKLVAEGKIKKSKPLAEITDDEKPFKLPVGWEFTRFGEYLDFQGGGQPPKDVFVEHQLEGYVQLIQIRDLGKNPQPVYIPIELASKFCTTTDIMIGRYGASVGKVFWGNNGSYNVALVKIIDDLGLYSKRFLFEFLRSPLGQSFFNGISRSAQAGFNKTDIESNIVPIPPLAEQHRIVAKVDELMALCDQLENQHNNAAEAHEKLVTHLLGTLTQSQNAEEFKTNWQRISEHFDTLFTTEASIDALKQTLLQLAVMGKVIPQDHNDEPASELLKRIQAEKAKLVAEGKIKKDKPLAEITDEEKPFDLPVGWEWIRVSTIAEIITSGSRDWAKYLSNEGAKFITMGNLSRGSYNLRLENMRYVNPPEDGEGSRTKLKEDDLLISITGDVGNLGRIPTNFGDAYINQHTCLLRFISECRNRFFPETLRSPMAISQFIEPQRGIKNSFRLGDLAEMVIPLPPKNEQYRIVNKMDELMAISDQLKASITSSNQLQQKLADVVIEQALN
jgi:type I restriction enzyme S subunit